MMYKFSFLMSLLAAPLLWADVVVLNYVERFSGGDLSIRLVVDERRVVKIQGLPVQGDYYYDAARAALVMRHPEEQQHYVLPALTAEGGLRVPQLRRVGPWREYMGTATTQWSLHNGKYPCGAVFTSKALAEQAGISYSDVMRISNSLRYLFGGEPQHACEKSRLTAAQGRLAGLPVYMSDYSGVTTDLVKLNRESASPHVLPQDPALLNAPAHLRFLKRANDGDLVSAFEQASGQLPYGQQVRALRQMIGREQARQ